MKEKLENLMESVMDFMDSIVATVRGRAILVIGFVLYLTMLIVFGGATGFFIGIVVPLALFAIFGVVVLILYWIVDTDD